MTIMAKILTNQRDVPFELSFKYPLEKGYTFKEMSMKNIKEFQAFLDKVARMTVQQVDHLYARRPDTNDCYNGMQIYHYPVCRKTPCFSYGDIRHFHRIYASN